MSLRPSKTALFQKLETDLNTVEQACPNGLGVDAASANFKNKKLFGSLKYVGVDIDEDALRRGRQQFPESYGLLIDLGQAELPIQLADVVVSTNTIEALPLGKARAHFLEQIIRTTKTGGTLLLSIHAKDLSESLYHLVQSSFQHIEISYYRGLLSRIYEDQLIIPLQRQIVARNFFWRVVNKLVQQFYPLLVWHERRSSFQPARKEIFYIKATGKKGEGRAAPSTLPPTNAESLGDNLWHISC
jgi:SAM-dependent methyltransferase